MIAVDSDLLVYAHRREADRHEHAFALIRQLAEGREEWGIPWLCLHEFFAISTHPSIWNPPTPAEDALSQIDAWLESPTVSVLYDGPDQWSRLRAVIESGHVKGYRVHDARIAALCLTYGVDEFWTGSRDLSRFPSIATKNPLLG